MIGATGSKKGQVLLVQQGVWDMPKETMPLASGYLKAAALQCEQIKEELDIKICNFGGGHRVGQMAHALFAERIPDVLAFSVFGWNYRQFGGLAETFRQLNPNGWIIFGGTHVAHQAIKVLGSCAAVDIVVNGEGEYIFRDLLSAFLNGRPRHELSAIEGISYRSEAGEVVTTPARSRIRDLDEIPSPFISGAIPMTDSTGHFPYSVALMETNRGCPYSCAFCFWGGAVGQKVHSFSRERLREELAYFGFHGVDTVVLCDANFGMLPADKEFVEDVIRTRAKFGCPRTLETSWAKNKSAIFYSIVRRMKEQRLASSFTLALQTLEDEALIGMHRRNMRLNEWEDLIEWLSTQGVDCYAELIWGAPGQTCDSFIEGYDRLARYVSKIATYPLLLLPNTAYSIERQKHGFITVRGESDDFEYVLEHRTMSFPDNQKMQRFLLWARVFAEHMVFRHIWSPLRLLAGMSQSQVLIDMSEWFEQSPDPLTQPLRHEPGRFVDDKIIGSTLRHVYRGTRKLRVLFDSWWMQKIYPRVPPSVRGFLNEVWYFEWLTLPIYLDGDREQAPDYVDTVSINGLAYYRRRSVNLKYEIPQTVRAMQSGQAYELLPHAHTTDVFYRTGFIDVVDSHELAKHYFGLTTSELQAAHGPVAISEFATTVSKSNEPPGFNKEPERSGFY